MKIERPKKYATEEERVAALKDARRRANQKYRDSGNYKNITITLNTNTDKDIIIWLNNLDESRLGYFKRLIRQDIAAHSST